MTSRVERDRVSVEGIRQRSEAAFTELVNNYYASLCQFVQSVTSSNDYVEEAVTDVFMSIWESSAQSVPLNAVPQYLYAAARNNAFMHSKRSTSTCFPLVCFGLQFSKDILPRGFILESEVYSDEVEFAHLELVPLEVCVFHPV